MAHAGEVAQPPQWLEAATYSISLLEQHPLNP